MGNITHVPLSPPLHIAPDPIGTPAVVFVMLWRHRDKLYPPGLRNGPKARATVMITATEARILEGRSGLREEAPITAFAERYRPRYWYVARGVNSSNF